MTQLARTLAGKPMALRRPTYGGRILSDGGSNLLGYWPLDAQFGLTDRAASPHNLTATGSATTGGAQGTGGRTATTFDGTDDTFTTALACFVVSSVRTFELWAWRDSAATGYRCMLGSTGSSAVAWGFYSTGTGGNVELYPSNGGIHFFQWAGAISGTDDWNHVVLVYDEGGLSADLYVNGAFVSNQTVAAGGYDASVGNFQIGGYAGATPHAGDTQQGRLAHVAVYSGDQSAFALSHYALGRRFQAARQAKLIG